MHGGAVRGHGSGGRDDAGDACTTERADVQEVLAMHDDQVDEGNDLAHVGDGTADVHRAQCSEDACNLVERPIEADAAALAAVHSRVNGEAHVGEVGDHHADVHSTLHSNSNRTLSNEQSSAIPYRLVSENADLRGCQLRGYPRACGRGEGSSRRQLAHHGDEASDADGAHRIHIEVEGTVRGGIGKLGSRICHPGHQNGAVHLTGKLRLTVTRSRTGPDDRIDVIPHADHGHEGLQHIECTVGIGGLSHALLPSCRLVSDNLVLGQHLSGGIGRVCRQSTNLALLEVLGILAAGAFHGLQHDLLCGRVLLNLVHGWDSMNNILKLPY